MNKSWHTVEPCAATALRNPTARIVAVKDDWCDNAISAIAIAVVKTGAQVLDNNDNNLDDNLELLGLLGLGKHLQNQREQAKTLDDLAAEQRKQSSEKRRLERLPQCPWCGGRLQGEFQKCMHCASDISWVEGTPCKPGEESATAQMLREKERHRAQFLLSPKELAERDRAREEAQEQEKMEKELQQHVLLVGLAVGISAWIITAFLCIAILGFSLFDGNIAWGSEKTKRFLAFFFFTIPIGLIAGGIAYSLAMRNARVAAMESAAGREKRAISQEDLGKLLGRAIIGTPRMVNRALRRISGEGNDIVYRALQVTVLALCLALPAVAIWLVLG